MAEANEIENETAEGRPTENINEAGDDGAVPGHWMTADGLQNIRALHQGPAKQQKVQQFIEDNYVNKEFTIRAIVDIVNKVSEAVNTIAVSKSTVYNAVEKLRRGNIYELTYPSNVPESQYISTEGIIIEYISCLDKSGKKTFTVDDIFNGVDVLFTDVSGTIEKLIDSNQLKLVRGLSSQKVGREYIYKLIR